MEKGCWIILIKDNKRQTWCCLPCWPVVVRLITAWTTSQPWAVGHIRSVVTSRSPQGNANPPFAQVLSPACLRVPYSSENIPTPLPVCMLQRCAASREFGRWPPTRGFRIPSSHPHQTRPEPLGLYSSQPETKGRETWSSIHVWRSLGFFSLLFKHSMNIHKAHTLQIICYYF